MIEFINLLKPYAELVYLISGPVVAFIAFKALAQISVARNATKIQSKRESIRLAAERCEYFHREIEPAVTAFFGRLREKNIDFLEKCEVVIDENKIKFKPCKDKEALDKLVAEIDCFSDLFNRLELFAMYFTGRIANESFAYHALGSTYCKLIKRLIPMLMMNMFKNDCKHIMSLFFIWYPRIQKISNEKQKEELKKQLSELNEKEIPDSKIKPIGA